MSNMDFYDYFQSYENYFWKWEEKGEVLAINGGSTIAYKQLILEILDNLSEQGIPPFGSLLLAIVATNNTLGNSLEHIKEIVLSNFKHSEEYTNLLLTDSPFEFFDTLKLLPEEYKAGSKRFILMQTIFADCHNITGNAKAKEIVLQFKEGLYSTDKLLQTKEFSFNNFAKDFKTISLLKKKFPTTQSIIDAMAALPAVTSEFVLWSDKNVSVTKEDFFEDLMENAETFEIATLIKHIWSGLNLPFSPTSPSDQPLGGVSDLSNKGSFDKLLVSEFANEDLIFLSRLANNEALYYRREVPPANDNLERIVLIDVSLKSWGIPKTLAYAVLIALAKHPKANYSYKAYAVGDSYIPIIFDDVHKTIESLQILETSVNCAEGLKSFFQNNTNFKNTEIFFISSSEGIKASKIKKVLSDYSSHFDYLIITQRDGKIDLFKRKQNNQKHLQSFQLPLKELWKKRNKALEKRQNDNEFLQTKFPILFPEDNSCKSILISNEKEIFFVTPQHKLFKTSLPSTTESTKSWELLAENLPEDAMNYSIGKKMNGDLLLLCFIRKSRTIILHNLNTQITQEIHFPEWHRTIYENFIFYKEAFHFLDHHNYWSIEETPDIRITKNTRNDQFMHEIYMENERMKRDIQAKIKLLKRNVFKKIRNGVHISPANSLIINGYKLSLLKNDEIHLTQQYLPIKIQSSNAARDLFVFPDGSSVSINRAGLFILQSSDSSIPKIYIAASTHHKLGVATDEQFAGNEYYYPNTKSNLSIIEPKIFMKENIDRFIQTIVNHAT